MTEREACIILNMIPGIGRARYLALVNACGGGVAALNAPPAQLARIHGFGEQLIDTMTRWPELVDYAGELALAAQGGARILTMLDDDYPPDLKEIPDPPLCLYVRGTLPDFTGRTVAIVGSRRMSSYGRRMAERLSAEAVSAGWIVVSGLAYGVDAVAHQSALANGGLTVAVLGSGLARVHPQEHVGLAREIVAAGGALLSEYPMLMPVNRRSLPRRNRIVSGLAAATVVVEAGLDSGALITAKLALEQGRDVFAVPGQADNPQAAGCNRLIKEGAKLTESFRDVTDDLQFGHLFEAPAPGSAPGRTPDLFLSDEERQVCAILERDGQLRADLLAERTGLETGRLRGCLMKLDLDGRVVRLPGDVYALR